MAMVPDNHQPSSKISSLHTQDALRYNVMCWRLIGMYPYEKYQTIYWIYSILLNICCTVIYVPLYFVPFFLDSDSTDTLAKLSVIFPLVNSSSKQAVVFYHMHRNLPKAALHLQALDRRAEGQAEECNFLNNKIRQCHWIFFTGVTLYFLCLLVFGLVSVSQHHLPFEGWMPFDWQHIVWIYILACAVQCFCLGIQGSSAACSDTYSIIYLKLLEAHLRILNARITRLGGDRDEKIDGRQKNRDTYRDLAECVQDHRECIHYFNCIRPAIAATLFVQFFNSAAVLCSAAITFVNAGLNFSQVVKFISYVVLTLLQTAPCCFYMDEIRAQLQNLTTSMYSCRWYDQDQRFRRALIIFMQRSQIVENMLAGNLISVSLDTFVGFMKFNFSLFTLLNKVKTR